LIFWIAHNYTSARLISTKRCCALHAEVQKIERFMRTGTVKGSLRLFGIVAVGTGVFGLWQGYGIGETLIAAVILSAFVVGIAWVGVRADRRFNRK
jgi:hypothetical protein